ncbi:hypothetical protein D3C80_1557520 [compost metagenome]
MSASSEISKTVILEIALVFNNVRKACFIDALVLIDRLSPTINPISVQLASTCSLINKSNELTIFYYVTAYYNK